MKRFCVVMCVLVAGCEAASGVADRPGPIVVTAIDTLISTESGALASGVDLDVAPGGRVYVADYQADQVFSIDPDSRDTLRIGRAGDGPGELDAPWTIRAFREGILVVDRGNGRIQRLDSMGAYVSSHPVTPMVVRAFPFLGVNGDMVIGTGGQDSCLAIVFDSSGAERSRVGLPIVTPPGIADFGAIKAQIREGKVPADLRNESLVASDSDGTVWVALQTEGEVRRYAPDGALEWSTTVVEPEMAAARDTFFTRNRREPDPSRIYSLRYFRDTVLLGEDLWVLLDTPPDSPAVILVFNATGKSQRIEVQGGGGAGQIAVDPQRRRLFLFTAHDAQLLLGALPGT